MAETVLFPQEECGFAYLEDFGVFGVAIAPPPFEIALGETYKVVWDGVAYETAAMDSGAVIEGSISIGNGAPFGLHGNNEPFAIGYTPGAAVIIMSLTDTAPANHTVAVYHLTEDIITYTIQSTTLKAIGDAIRRKTGGTAKLTPENMPNAISSITGGGGGSSADVRYVTFVNDSTGESFVKAVATGDDCVDVVAKGLWKKPTQESSAQYNYTFYGWGAEPNGAADANILKNITEDKTVYAIFTATLRSYTITYYDSDGTTVLNTEKLVYGSKPTYVPTKTGVAFDGWTPTPTEVTGNASYKASWTSAIASGVCGTNATWMLDTDYTLRIKGTGAVEDYTGYDKAKPTWNTYAAQIKKVIVEDGITDLGARAFNNYYFEYTNLTSITLGAGVADGVTQSFDKCLALTQFVVSADNTVYDAIDGVLCNKAHTTIIIYPLGKGGHYTVPDTIRSIDSYAFYDGDNKGKITGITFNDKLESIGVRAFQGCKNFTSIVLPNSVKSVAEYAFISCKGLTSITVPASVTSWGKSAFHACDGLTSVAFEPGFTTIAEGMFTACAKLTSVTIPNSVTSIGNNAFENCSLKSVTIPSNVVRIGSSAFRNNSLTIGSGAVFEVTAGWTAGTTALAESDLADPKKAANYLQNTYMGSVWTRT